MRVKTPNHAVAKGAVFKGDKVKLRGRALGTGTLNTYWNDELTPTDSYTLDENLIDIGTYGDPYGQVKYAGGANSRNFYETFPLYGRGDQLSLEIMLLIVARDAIIDRIEIQTATKGFTQNG
jgi:hypothetical protein